VLDQELAIDTDCGQTYSQSHSLSYKLKHHYILSSCGKRMSEGREGYELLPLGIKKEATLLKK